MYEKHSKIDSIVMAALLFPPRSIIESCGADLWDVLTVVPAEPGSTTLALGFDLEEASVPRSALRGFSSQHTHQQEGVRAVR